MTTPELRNAFTRSGEDECGKQKAMDAFSSADDKILRKATAAEYAEFLIEYLKVGGKITVTDGCFFKYINIKIAAPPTKSTKSIRLKSLDKGIIGIIVPKGMKVTCEENADLNPIFYMMKGSVKEDDSLMENGDELDKESVKITIYREVAYEMLKKWDSEINEKFKFKKEHFAADVKESVIEMLRAGVSDFRTDEEKYAAATCE